MLNKISNSNIKILVDEWIHNERDRKIIKRRFIDGIIYEKIAEEFDLSVAQIKNIIYKAEKELIKYL